MILERLFENLVLDVDPFATCQLADGWRLRLPCRDWVTFHYTLEGGGGLRLGTGETLPLAANVLAVMPPNFSHAIQCGPEVEHETGVEGQAVEGPLCQFVAGPLDNVSLTIACGRIQVTYGEGLGLFDHLQKAIVIDFNDSPQMRTTFEALVNEYQESGAASHAMMTALMNQCLILVLRRVSEESQGSLPWLAALEDPQLAGVIDAMLEHPEQHQTVESLAAIAHMSRSAFARRFTECFNRTPMDYLRDVRLRRAAQLLGRDELSVEEVATKVGFSSRSHFSRTFHEHFGASPLAFREARAPH
ncbi:MAG: helix-turn-helix transcriptional regulator [Myxococcales bacterium]|nr:MAG: helix-turn-helix transcriptional regulator [Myxococcales bacterium]